MGTGGGSGLGFEGEPGAGGGAGFFFLGWNRVCGFLGGMGAEHKGGVVASDAIDALYVHALSQTASAFFKER